MSHPGFTIRATTPADTDALTDLVSVGDRTYVPGSTGLVAEIDGTVAAAIALTSGAVAADRDHAHPSVVDCLRYRRYQILRQGGDVGRARHIVQRLAAKRVRLSQSAA
jgi:hypothetical protein